MENLSTRAVMEDVPARVVAAQPIEPSQDGVEDSAGPCASRSSPGLSTPQSSCFEDEEIIEEAKCHSPAPVPPADEGELPDLSGQPRVTLMVVNSYLVYAYWNVDLTRLPAQTVGAALRFHDLSEPFQSHFFEVDVDLRTRNWYVHLWSPAKSYYADLVVKTADGGDTYLARSNQLQTPRAWPVAEIEGPSIAVAAVPPLFTGPDSPEAAAPGRIEGQSFPEEITGVRQHTQSEEHPARTPPVADPQPEAYKVSDAAGVLQRRLSELYSLRPWHPRALVATSAAPNDAPLAGWGPVAPLPQAAVEPPPAWHALPQPSLQPETAFDLTALAEHEFHPGFSSALLSSPTPERPPG